MAIIDELKKQKALEDEQKKEIPLRMEEKDSVEEICSGVIENLSKKVQYAINKSKVIYIFGCVGINSNGDDLPFYICNSGWPHKYAKENFKKGLYYIPYRNDERNCYWRDQNKAQIIADKLAKIIREEFRPDKLEITVKNVDLGTFWNPIYSYCIQVDLKISL